jgi:curved DNA-binding protein CbpA
MSDAFDPFHEWLGIPPLEQPANYYRLLGLNVFESDLAAIQLAAKRRTMLVQPHIAGPNGAIAQKLLQQINAARQLLSNADKKETYDAALRQKRVAITPQATPS